MKRITRIIRPIICMAVLLFAMTTAVMGCYQKEAEPIDIPDRTPSGTSAPQPSATPAGEVIPSVDRQAELAEARAKNPDTVAWLYIPGAEVDDPVMQAEDNGYYLKLDENGEYAMWGCYYAHCENEIGGRDNHCFRSLRQQLRPGRCAVHQALPLYGRRLCKGASVYLSLCGWRGHDFPDHRSIRHGYWL